MAVKQLRSRETVLFPRGSPAAAWVSICTITENIRRNCGGRMFGWQPRDSEKTLSSKSNGMSAFYGKEKTEPLQATISLPIRAHISAYTYEPTFKLQSLRKALSPYHSQLFLSILHKHWSPPSGQVCHEGLSAWGVPVQSLSSSAETQMPLCSCAGESASGRGEWLPVHGTTGTQENLWE